MSKHRIEQDLEEVLSGVSSAERLQLWIEAKAKEKDQRDKLLVVTFPTHDYHGADLTFTERGHYSSKFLNNVVYSLHTKTGPA